MVFICFDSKAVMNIELSQHQSDEKAGMIYGSFFKLVSPFNRTGGTKRVPRGTNRVPEDIFWKKTLTKQGNGRNRQDRSLF